MNRQTCIKNTSTSKNRSDQGVEMYFANPHISQGSKNKF